MSVRDQECLGSWVYGGESVHVVLAASFTAGFAAGICLPLACLPSACLPLACRMIFCNCANC